jgi:predicted HAD superfamily hydrolase
MDESIIKFLNDFRENFSDVKNKKIVLYGIGKLSALLVNELNEFNIIGLMDKDPGNIGKKFFPERDIVVISSEEACTQADLIIIVSSEVYWDIIFERIMPLYKDYGIPIYFLNGNQAVKKEPKYINRNDSYWNSNQNLLYKAIDEHDVISFDIFDTLVMRKVVLPEDVFLLTELRLKKNKDFFYYRKLAYEKAYNDKKDNTTLDDIYKYLGQLMALDDFQIDKMKDLEINTEYDLIIPREVMVKALHYASEKGKKIYLLTDTYLSSDIVKNILNRINIKVEFELWVSNECKLQKHNKSMWRYYSQINDGQKCLHIGDNINSDIKNPRAYGIDTFYVMSGYDMLLHSSLKEVSSYITTLAESILIGNIIARLFNNPFILNKSKGQVEIEEFSMLGYLGYGGLVFNYLIWLIKETSRAKIEKILFFSRDGYVLERIYRKLVKQINLRNAPEGIYFKISRRLIMEASIRDDETLREVVSYEYYGTFAKYLYAKFGLNCELNDINKDKIINSITDSMSIMEYLKPYKKRILENAQNHRKNYLDYINGLDVFNANELGIVDLFFSGTSQYYLSKLIRKKIKGFYFCALLNQNNTYGIGYDMKALYQNREDLKAEKSNVRRYSQIIESVFTSPEGMYINCNSDMSFTNAAKNKNQLIFFEKEKIHSGINLFIDDMLKVYNGIDIDNIPYTAMFVDYLFGLIFSDRCKITREIQKSFTHDDELFGFINRHIWE